MPLLCSCVHHLIVEIRVQLQWYPYLAFNNIADIGLSSHQTDEPAPVFCITCAYDMDLKRILLDSWEIFNTENRKEIGSKTIFQPKFLSCSHYLKTPINCICINKIFLCKRRKKDFDVKSITNPLNWFEKRTCPPAISILKTFLSYWVSSSTYAKHFWSEYIPFKNISKNLYFLNVKLK